MDAREAADLRVPLGPPFHGNPGSFQLGDHRIEISDTEVDHPLLLVPPEIVGIGREWREDGRAGLLVPDCLTRIDAEMRDIPGHQMVGVPCPEEQTADPGHPLHRRTLPDVVTSLPHRTGCVHKRG